MTTDDAIIGTKECDPHVNDELGQHVNIKLGQQVNIELGQQVNDELGQHVNIDGKLEEQQQNVEIASTTDWAQSLLGAGNPRSLKKPGVLVKKIVIVSFNRQWPRQI